jgi:hypothetical protein
MLIHPSLFNRLIASAAVLALAFGAAACGGSDDESAEDAATTTSPATTAEGMPLTEKQRVRATVDRLYEAHRNEDPRGVCAELSAPAREQIVQGELGGEGVSCEESFEEFFSQSEGSEEERSTQTAKVGKVRVNGRRAVASVKFGTRPGEIPLVKVNGKWKLDAVGAAQPSP